jgi:hypothetical protein
MHGRLCIQAGCALALTFATAAAMPAVAPGTLVRHVAIAIQTENSGASRSFALTARARPRARDAGPALRTVTGQTTDGRTWRHVTGTELLDGARGTLKLRWSGSQRWSGGRWGALTGTWSIEDGTGAYAGRFGRGVFVSRDSTTEYVGWLINAM